ncbi:MAG TPA: S9 family peptidase [Ktedonobacterales bacterium]|nr:S9 family peptidase [Ktedonobacterales bacterium]
MATEPKNTADETNTGYSFERYLNVRSATGASFAPDGGRLSFLTDITGVAEVWGVGLDPRIGAPPWPEQLTFRGERVLGARFAPGAATLLVSGDIGGNEHAQLFTLSGDGAQFTPLTDRPETIYQFGDWSPDGARILYASNERDPRYFDVYERDLASGATTLLLQYDGMATPTRYAPDGRSALVEQRLGAYYRSRLMLVGTTSGEVGAVRALTPQIDEGTAQHIFAAWSADRNGLYLLSDRGRQFRALAWLDLASDELTYLRDEPWDAEELALSADGTRLALTTNEDGYSRLELFDVADGWEARTPLPTPTLPDRLRGVALELSWSPDGQRLAFTLAPAADAVDVWVWDTQAGTLTRATRSALGGVPRASFVAPTLVHYPTFDGRQIPAFLYRPPQGPQTGLPVVVYVHGGPESQFRPTYNAVIQYLVARGYGVLAPNVRGSSGYGYDYMALDDVRLRMDSVNDLRHAALWLAETGVADAKRIAVMGGSYGGFMVLSAVTTYPDLWAAGVDIVGIANFVTFLENTGPWRRKLREVEYGSLEADGAFLEEISPIHHVDRITAPLFVVHGANDPRVPIGEAEQIVASLRARGGLVEYLRFEDEGHGLIKRANRLVAYPAIARFLDEHVGRG